MNFPNKDSTTTFSQLTEVGMLWKCQALNTLFCRKTRCARICYSLTNYYFLEFQFCFVLVAGHGPFDRSWWFAWYRRCRQTDSSADTTTSLLLQVWLTLNTASSLEFWKYHILGGETVQNCVVVNHLLVEVVPVLFATSLACCCVVQRCYPPKSSAAAIDKIKTNRCHKKALTTKAACLEVPRSNRGL